MGTRRHPSVWDKSQSRRWGRYWEPCEDCVLRLCKCLFLKTFVLTIWQVNNHWDRAVKMSRWWGKMRTYIPQFCASFSMSPITSLLDYRISEMIYQAKTKSPSKTNLRFACLYYFHCVFKLSKCHSFAAVSFSCRFVSISKNYRSVIRACMEELQQIAGISSSVLLCGPHCRTSLCKEFDLTIVPIFCEKINLFCLTSTMNQSPSLCSPL